MKGDNAMMEKRMEKCSFKVTYTGKPETIKDFDFSESLDGIEELLKTSYQILYGRPEDLFVNITEVKEGVPDTERTFLVTVLTELSEVKERLPELIEHIGFMVKPKKR